MKTREEIMERVRRHYGCAKQKFGEENILGVFLYGSQNYHCDTANSDVDTKCILVPDLFHLAISPYEVKHLDVDGEVCECMTIMHMVDNWKKQNINFLEIMFTEFYIINPTFSHYWIEFIHQYREEIARYNMKRGLNSIARQAMYTITQNPEDGKKIGNGVRLLDTLQKYISGCRYQECIIPTLGKRDLIRAFKNGSYPVPQEYGELLLRQFEVLLEENEDKVFPQNQFELDDKLNQFILRLIEHRIKEI